jgi:hypothetical protein
MRGSRIIRSARFFAFCVCPFIISFPMVDYISKKSSDRRPRLRTG